MFTPDDIIRLKKQMKALNIDKAALEKAAESLMNVPELRQVFEHKSFEEGFKRNVDQLYDEVNDIFDDHKEYPDGGEKRKKPSKSE